MAVDPHHISVRDAAVLTQRWRDSKPPQDFKGARFDRIAFDNLLKQAGCEGIRIYMGLQLASEVPPGEPLWTFVMIGTDAAGNDMIPPQASKSMARLESGEEGDPEEHPVKCPPSCGDSNPLNSPP